MRQIIHADINYCYAQIEELKNPDLKLVPMVVGGSEAKRQGIVLAKNPLASAYGISTADTLYVARRKCPKLVVVPPAFEDYMRVTEQVKDIYREYTDQVESFGLDEAWIDVTGSQRLFGPGLKIAKTIQRRVYEEIGLTISIGFSWNKIFAKLGSDMQKPAGFTVITKENYKQIVWPLNADVLLGVGRKTYPKLMQMDVITVSDLANACSKKLHRRLGKQGLQLKKFALGLDDSTVKTLQELPEAKSIGNSVTLERDIYSYKEAHLVLRRLAESVASRMRDESYVGQVVSLSVRNEKLETYSKQFKMQQHSDVSSVIYKMATYLLEESYPGFELGIRSLGISVSELVEKKQTVKQTSIFETRSEIDYVLDDLQMKYGDQVVTRASMLLDTSLTDFNPKKQHKIHPVSFI